MLFTVTWPCERVLHTHCVVSWDKWGPSGYHPLRLSRVHMLADNMTANLHFQTLNLLALFVRIIYTFSRPLRALSHLL